MTSRMFRAPNGLEVRGGVEARTGVEPVYEVLQTVLRWGWSPCICAFGGGWRARLCDFCASVLGLEFCRSLYRPLLLEGFGHQLHGLAGLFLLRVHVTHDGL